MSLPTLRRAAPAPASFRTCSAYVRNYSDGISLPSEASSEQSRKPHRSRTKKPEKQIFFSGIQPTGVPHLGNYLGALRQWVKLEKEASRHDQVLFSIADLHAITIKQDPAELAKWRKEMLASLLAVGLNPKKSLIFEQSSVKAHTDLMWILSCSASMGYLGRMTQWKSKLSLPSDASPTDSSPSNKDSLKLGLFSYPVLQAADILLYRSTHVPVGEDQAQHLEFTRDLAAGFNHLHAPQSAPILTLPQTILNPAKRIMSLTEPTKKMSKSATNPKSRILITDSKEEIHAKLKTALTDSIEGISYDRQNRPGVTNLIDVLYHFDDSVAASPEELAQELKDVSMRALKEKVADTVNDGIRDVRERYEEIMGAQESVMRDVLSRGRARASSASGRTMWDVYRALGLRS